MSKKMEKLILGSEILKNIFITIKVPGLNMAHLPLIHVPVNPFFKNLWSK